jgi:A/G-specific adenine glycosylase
MKPAPIGSTGANFRSQRQCAKMPRVSFRSVPVRELQKFRERVLSWFAKHRRDLPWRRTRDAYRVWVSEVMLQQTRVAAVIPYYERFLANFPDVNTLAGARSERVLAAWAGLGYYSRARNLHRAAREIVARHEGHFPREHDLALSLPGIGRYTAAAVLSIAYGEPLAVLDGNVARVLARMGALRGELRAPAMWRRLEERAEGLLARDSPGDWNQAMMELGATLCTPESPRCEDCPAARWCGARKLGIAEDLPSARKKRSPVDITLAAAVFLDPCGRTLLVRSRADDAALFSRMWQFPAVEATGKNPKAVLAAYLRAHFGAASNGRLTPLAPARHTVTYRNIRLEPFLERVAHLPRAAEGRVVKLARLHRLPVSNATRKIAGVAMAGT